MSAPLKPKLHQRWYDLDPRTIEFIARLNEDERRRLIELGSLSEKEVERLQKFLALDDERWEAGFTIVARSVVISKAIRKFPVFLMTFAAMLVAVNQIFGSLSAPFQWLLRSLK